MSKKSETSKTASGAQITTIGGSNVSRETVRACHKQVMATAHVVGVQDGVKVEVHVGTNKTRCGTRRNGVHYEEDGVHILGINHKLVYGGGLGFSRQGRSTLAHEMIHADQFSSGRCKRDGYVHRYGAYQSLYYFTGSWNGNQGERNYVNAEIARPRSPTYKTYRNFPWEQEAFEMQDKVARQAYNMSEEDDTPKFVEAPKFTVEAAAFTCPHCGKGYASRQGRYKHIKGNHCGHQ